LQNAAQSPLLPVQHPEGQFHEIAQRLADFFDFGADEFVDGGGGAEFEEFEAVDGLCDAETGLGLDLAVAEEDLLDPVF
jgi:hypothetical protein